MRIGVLKGNGIGPEIMRASQRILEATGIPIQWEDILIADEAIEKHGHPIPPETVAQLRSVGVTLKAPIITHKLVGRITCLQPDGTSATYPSLNNAIRRELGLFVNPRPVKGYAGVSGRYEELDCIIMREVTEDLYSGIEHRIGGHIAAEAIKLTTRAAATRVARYSFEYARKYGRKRVTCLHKANVLNYTDGLFLRCFREVSKDYEDIETEELMIDAACYLIVKDPKRFDVVLAANQYGDIFSDLAAGLIGSLGLAPGMNVSDDLAVFEASHGAAPDIAGKGIANPLALVLSGALLLESVDRRKEANAVREAVRIVVEEQKDLPPDLGGSGTSDSLTDAVVREVKRILTCT
ncbi:Isocitrate dehydrogenase [NAD] catalytic subunit 5 [Colletotrichum tropicale]|nr:Isocitrate dehydrogenase [NAD] catalytic subunit 5 [Colletotrichum tropicale]